MRTFWVICRVSSALEIATILIAVAWVWTLLAGIEVPVWVSLVCLVIVVAMVAQAVRRHRRMGPLRAAKKRLWRVLDTLSLEDGHFEVSDLSRRRARVEPAGIARYRIHIDDDFRDDPHDHDMVIRTCYTLFRPFDEVPKEVVVGRFDKYGVARFDAGVDKATWIDRYVNSVMALRAADVAELDDLARILTTGTFPDRDTE